MSDLYGEHGAAETESGALAVSANDFSALEERVLRAVELVKRERHERTAAESRAVQAEERVAQTEERLAHAEARAAQAEERAGHNEARAAQADTKVHELTPVMEAMHAEMKALKSERDHVRNRVERLLEQLDGLEV